MSTLLATFVLIFLATTTARPGGGERKVDVGCGGPQAPGNVAGERSVVSKRRRRQTETDCETTPTAFTADMINVTLKLHNDRRASEGGSNIELIKWSNLLADMGQAATDYCDFSHFNHECNGATFGQNIAMFNYDVRARLEVVMDAWYTEKSFYDFDTLECEDEKVCGHYLQMVLYSVSEMGCGITKCDTVPMPDGDWTDSYVIFCNYNHVRNGGEPPYLKGLPCDRCETSPGWKCVDDLCEQCDPASDIVCNQEYCPVEKVDKYSTQKCSRYKSKNYCVTKAHIMKLACAKTCDLCPE